MRQFKADRKRWTGIITAAIVTVLILTAGISVYSYSALGNQLSRQLTLGHKYLEDGQYEEAVLAFENAISIDEKCMEAYAGGMEAYLYMGENDSLVSFYERARSAAGSLEAKFFEQNLEFIVEIYMAADRIYGDDSDEKIRVLEEGWELTGSPEIKKVLIEDYLESAEEKIADGDYEDGLVILDRLLELDEDNEKVQEALERYLLAYLEHLLEEKNYDEIRRLARKYGQIVTGIDFEKMLNSIEELEALEKESASVEEAEEDIEEGTDDTQEDELQEPEEEAASDENEDATVETVQSDNWVDDLYQKIIAEDVDAVFAIMEQPDFVEKCEAFPHTEVVWSMDYRLSTSSGKDIWVVRAIEYDGLSVAYCPSGMGYSENEAPPIYAGDYMFSIEFGLKKWFVGTTYHDGSGDTLEIEEGEFFETFHA